MGNLTIEQAKKLMEKYGGNMYLSGTGITSLPDGLKVKGDLDLENCKGITVLPKNLEVGGSLDLSDTAITKLPENLTVGGGLYLGGTAITKLPKNLTVGGGLDLGGTAITKLPENLTVGGWLYLDGTAITKLPENLTVGGGLYLGGTAITKLPKNLTVGGWLDLGGTAITKLPKNLTVGGGLYLDGTAIANQGFDKKVKKLKDGDYVEGNYLYADGILTHVKKRKKVGDYTVYIGKIPGENVVSDGTNYAHCSTLREGIADLQFKTAKDRGAKQYKHLNLDTELTVPEAMTMYRVITGACRQGTECFINSLGELKEKYTVNEIIKLTKGQYGAEKFAEFFVCA